MDAKQVPLRELLASVPADARLVIDDADGNGSTYIPVGRLCQEAAAALAEPGQEPDLSRCPKCGGPADNGHDRSIPPNPYFCTKCMAEPVECPNCASLEAQNTELDAKLAEMERGEPVTWRWGYRSVTTGEMDWRGYVEIPAHPSLRSLEIIMEPLYTAPPQRKPLTDGEIKRIDDSTHFHESPDWSLRFARAVERAHGIGEKE